jgi:hypothetical protein
MLEKEMKEILVFSTLRHCLSIDGGKINKEFKDSIKYLKKDFKTNKDNMSFGEKVIRARYNFETNKINLYTERARVVGGIATNDVKVNDIFIDIPLSINYNDLNIKYEKHIEQVRRNVCNMAYKYVNDMLVNFLLNNKDRDIITIVMLIVDNYKDAFKQGLISYGNEKIIMDRFINCIDKNNIDMIDKASQLKDEIEIISLLTQA